MNIVEAIKGLFVKEPEAVPEEEAPGIEILYAGDEPDEMLKAYVRNLRAWCGEQARVNNHAELLRKLYQKIEADLLKIGDNEVLEDHSGLAGAEPMTKKEVMEISGKLFDAVKAYDKRDLFRKAAGEVNVKAW